MKKISCIISAYNEGPRINYDLKVVSNHPLIDEVIVVDDGSSDNTSEEAFKFKDVRVIRHKENMGKTRSMLDGCNNSENDLVMFLDADLFDLNTDNISQLVKPILNGSVDMSIGMVKHDSNTSILANITGHGALSGQRAMKKEIALENLKKSHGYGAEAIINQYVIDNNMKFIVVNWLNVKATFRIKEMSVRESISSLIKTFRDIFSVVSPFKLIKQFIVMRKRSAKYEKNIKKC